MLLLILELLGIILVCLLGLSGGLAWMPLGVFRRIRLWFQASPYRLFVFVAIVSFGMNWFLASMRTPVPQTHDEFSYLLAADTFSKFRLTNPTHPHWEHFESFHIIQQPSYASKYQPGQGLFLAAGQLLTGSPIVGAWFGMSLMMVAASWMLLGWVPFRWAFGGSLILLCSAGVYIFWGQTFWGGQLPLAAAALVVGAIPRLLKEKSLVSSVLLGIGASLLALTRPYEGLLLVCFVGAWLFTKLISGATERKTLLVRLLPAACVGLATVVFMGVYNRQVTGEFTKFPYMVHSEQYEISPFFLWKSPENVKTYRHRQLTYFYSEILVPHFESQKNLQGFLQKKMPDAYLIWANFLGIFLTIPLVVCLLRPFSRQRPFWLLGCLCLLAGTLVIPWLQAHYLAVAVPFALLVIVDGIRKIAADRMRRTQKMIFALGAIYVAMFSFRLTLHTQKPVDLWSYDRARIIEKFEGLPGDDLVLVRYKYDHSPFEEWVYNEADIDNASVVWARELDEESNQRLMSYFSNRHVWLLMRNIEPARIIPYPQKPPTVPGQTPKKSTQSNAPPNQLTDNHP